MNGTPSVEMEACVYRDGAWVTIPILCNREPAPGEAAKKFWEREHRRVCAVYGITEDTVIIRPRNWPR